MPVDPQCQALLDRITSPSTPDFASLTPDQVRAGARRTRDILPPGPAVGAIHDYRLPVHGGEIALRAYTPITTPIAVIVYLHGGGWVVGGIDDSDGPNRMLANAASAIVLAVEYRLAPEYPFPTAIEDSYAALKWAHDILTPDGDRQLPLVVAGDSAGANIAAAVTMVARDTGGPAIARQLLIYPATDAACDSGSFAAFGTDKLPTLASMRWFWDQYAPTDAQKSHPHATVLHAPDLRGLPPALIHTAEFDPLRDEGEAYGRRLREAGVPVTIDRRPGMIHGYITFAQILAGGDAAITDLGNDIKCAVALARGSDHHSSRRRGA